MPTPVAAMVALLAGARPRVAAELLGDAHLAVPEALVALALAHLRHHRVDVVFRVVEVLEVLAALFAVIHHDEREASEQGVDVRGRDRHDVSKRRVIVESQRSDKIIISQISYLSITQMFLNFKHFMLYGLPYSCYTSLMQDYAPTGLPTLSIPDFGLPNLGMGISSEMLSIFFFIVIVFTLIYTILLFNQWRKYSPSPLRAFKYAAIYLIGTIGIILALLSLLPLYAGSL